jgi:hypothetical protein
MIFLFSTAIPNTGIRADLCIVVMIQIERIGDAGVDFLIVPLFICIYLCLRHCFIASGLANRLTRVSSANVLDEGLRIGGRGRRINLKVRFQTNKVNIVY